MNKPSNHTSPEVQKQAQALKDKATRAWKPTLWPMVQKLVREASAVNLRKRDLKRAAMVANGQMRGGFPKD